VELTKRAHLRHNRFFNHKTQNREEKRNSLPEKSRGAGIDREGAKSAKAIFHFAILAPSR
jgi:hypothetical protein